MTVLRPRPRLVLPRSWQSTQGNTHVLWLLKGYIGNIEKKMKNYYIVHWDYIRIMERTMETTVQHIGVI